MPVRFLSLLLVVALCCLPARLAAQSAADCLVAVGEALDSADTALFQRKVDVVALVSQAIDVFVGCASDPQMAQAMPPMLTLILSQAAKNDATGKAIKSMLFTECRAFLLQGVASGAFAGRPTGRNAGQGMLAPLFANASMGRKEIAAIGEPESQDNGWVVPFTLRDYGNGQNYALEGLVQDDHGELRVTKIMNLPEIFLQVLEEAQRYVE